AEAYIKDLQRTPDGGYVMAGYQYSPMPQKGWVLKMDADFNTCSFSGCDSTVYVGVGEEPILPLGDRFRVSPNPAQDYFTIENNSLGQNITFVLYDVMGRRVLSFIPENQSVVPIEHLSSGVYLYQILNPQNQILQHGKISIVR
ncbi:MAG: T9SS type A sorting domain-containing protein, partial [Chitinophagales bacterium]|nr:T9SS type A sorting domain-containing protein [Chitinophagales bacterium]